MSVFLCYHLSLCFLNKDSFPPLDGGVKCSFGVRVESSRQHSGVHRIYECVSRVCARVHIVVVTLGKFWSFGNPDSRTVMAAQPIWVVFFLLQFLSSDRNFPGCMACNLYLLCNDAFQ